MDDVVPPGTDEQKQALRELVYLGLGSSIVNICNSLEIDGGWLENFVLDEMRIGDFSE